MIRYEQHLAEIRETKRQIAMTNSKRRKYELRRHLNKLLREWKQAKTYRTQMKWSKFND